jgi:predicted thioesterase
MALEPGMGRSIDFVVEGRLLTDVGGTIGASVLSTPGMIRMIEAERGDPLLREPGGGKATVGFEVCVKHVAAAAEGSTCARTRSSVRSSMAASFASTSDKENR